MWPYRAVHKPIGQAAPTYAELLTAHWNALPLGRKLQILTYLAWRPLRTAMRAVAAAAAAAREWVAYAAALLRWAVSPGGRYAIADFTESSATFRAAKRVAPYVAIAIIVLMLAGPVRNTTNRDGAVERMSIVEQARAVRHYYPPRCYYEADGDVIVMDSTWRAIRPNDPRRNRLLAQFCQ